MSSYILEECTHVRTDETHAAELKCFVCSLCKLMNSEDASDLRRHDIQWWFDKNFVLTALNNTPYHM